jgi:putative serine protease PepD
MPTDWLFRPLSPITSLIAIAVLAVATWALVIVPLWRFCRSKFNVALIAASILAAVLIVVGLLQEPWLSRQIGIQRGTLHKKATQVTPSYTPAAKSEKLDLVGLAKGARSAVVSIEVFDEEHNSIGTGSGFFVSNDGLLVTNYHVIEKASSAVAKPASGEQLSIKGAVYFDRDNDLAVLPTQGNKFPFLALGNSSKIEVGDHVAVIGNPLGLEGSLSEGIISGKRDLTSARRALPTPVLSMEHYPPRRNFELPFDKPNWLQITAPISPGSSGSPVLDATGNVIGIATMVLRGGQSLNFAVPADVVIAMLQTRQEQRGKQRPLVAFRDLLNDDDLTQNILENVFNDSPELHNAMYGPGGSFGPGGFGKEKEPVDWSKALDLAKILVAKYPNITRSWYNLGDVYKKMGLTEDAIPAYQQAITLGKQQRDMDSGIMLSCWASLGSIYKRTERTTEAQFAFSQAIAGQKKAIDRLPKPESEQPPKNYPAEQVSKWRSALAMDRSMAISTLGDYYADAGDSERAKQSYLQAIRENPFKHSTGQEAFLWNLAKLCVKDDDEEAAFTRLYDAMVLDQRRNPEAEAWDFLSGAYYDAGKYEAATRCSRKANSFGLPR